MVFDKVIYGLTVSLRSISEDDAEATFLMRSDDEKARHIHKANGTIEDQLEFIRAQRRREGDYLFVIEDLDGKPIGMKGVYDYDPIAKTVETGRFMNFGTQIQGVEALYLSFVFAFECLGVERILMSALEPNTNMLGMQEKFGVVTINKSFNPDFGCDSIYSVLTKDVFSKTGPKIYELVKRFAPRFERKE